MADVFISYARSDEAIARRLAKALQSAGLDVWWDADLPAHRAYSEVIERKLAEAKSIVVLWSKSAAASQWVRAEADFARNAGKLVQAQLDGALPPMPFNQIQCADLKGWRGGPAHPGWTKLLASIKAVVSGEEQPNAAATGPRRGERLQRYRWPVAAALAFLVAVGVYLYAFGPPGEARKPIVAVLPFRSLDAQDESLVAGIWEDTRTAIGRNPQLVVLGPNTAQALADKGEAAARKAADYILEASVRTAGDRVRVSTDLVRTRDGEQVWSQDFDRKLDDVFALQSQIATEIEGRIRGRLAEKGGTTPEHIATSGDVYALYADARAKVRTRDFGDQVAAGARELQQVVRMDPNFAPGWAALAVASRLVSPSHKNWDLADHSDEYARKAVDLAPNLAAAHSALAFALDLKGPVARAEVERAVELDPNDYEALTWFGNMHSDAGDKNGAIASYRRAAAIEPFFWPAVMNLYEALKDIGDKKGIQQLIEDEDRVGATYLSSGVRMQNAYEKGNLAEAANIGLKTWTEAKSKNRPTIGVTLWTVLLQLGFADEAAKLGTGPDFARYLWNLDPRGLDILEAHRMDAHTFFMLQPLTENASRLYLLSGRGKKVADMYVSLAMQPAQFETLASGDGPNHFVACAPLIAIALKENGHRPEAAALLSLAEQRARTASNDGKPESSAWLARVYAAEGRKEEAVSLIVSAVSRGWVPRAPELLPDLHVDPALASLKGDQRFEKARDQILGVIARERAQVNLALVRKLDSLATN